MPLRVYWSAGGLFSEGLETHGRDGVTLKRRRPPVADCFRLRRRLGIEVGVEALRTWLEERTFTPAHVMRVAQRLRIARVMRPYLEAMQ